MANNALTLPSPVFRQEPFLSPVFRNISFSNVSDDSTPPSIQMPIRSLSDQPVHYYPGPLSSPTASRPVRVLLDQSPASAPPASVAFGKAFYGTPLAKVTVRSPQTQPPPLPFDRFRGHHELAEVPPVPGWNTLKPTSPLETSMTRGSLEAFPSTIQFPVSPHKQGGAAVSKGISGYPRFASQPSFEIHSSPSGSASSSRGSVPGQAISNSRVSKGYPRYASQPSAASPLERLPSVQEGSEKASRAGSVHRTIKRGTSPGVELRPSEVPGFSAQSSGRRSQLSQRDERGMSSSKSAAALGAGSLSERVSSSSSAALPLAGQYSERAIGSHRMGRCHSEAAIARADKLLQRQSVGSAQSGRRVLLRAGSGVLHGRSSAKQ